MKRNLKLAVLMLFVSVSAFAQNMQLLPNGIQYSILSAPTAGKKIKLEDVITFNFIVKTDKDSILRNTYTDGAPVKLQVQPTKGLGDLMDVFTLLSEKDSALVKIPADSMFKENEQGRPPFFPKGSSLVFTIKIDRVQSLEEAMAESAKLIEELKNKEKASLAGYLAASKLSVKATPSGLMYLITTPSVKPKPVKGDTVFVNYIGRTIEGKVFDTSIEAEAQKAGLNQPGRPYEPIQFAVGVGEVIKGWDEGLLLFNEGSKGKLIVQSDLAYGDQSAGEDIKPYSTLLFDIELVKVKHPKKAVAATAKKPVAKAAAKPVVKKPAAATTAKPAAAKPTAKPAATVKKAPVKK